MRTKRRIRVSLECLEEKALLAVVGGAGLQVGPAPPNAEVLALQHIASLNNQQIFLTQLGALLAYGGNLQTNAQSMLDNARDVDLQLQDLGDKEGTVLPTDISDSDESTSQTVVKAIGTAPFTPAYVLASLQNNANLLGQLAALRGSASDSETSAFATHAMVIVANSLKSEIAVLGGATAPGSPTGVSPTSATLNPADLNTLESSYSTTQMERFLAQLTDLQTSNPDVMQYAEKLVDDHEMESVQTGRYAAATSTFLPAGIQGMDVQTAMQVISAANTSSYDRNYLTAMVQSHTQDIQSNQQTIASTQNPTLKEFAMSDLPTDWLHRAGAQLLLQGLSGSSGSGSGSGSGNGGSTGHGGSHNRHIVVHHTGRGVHRTVAFRGHATAEARFG